MKRRGRAVPSSLRSLRAEAMWYRSRPRLRLPTSMTCPRTGPSCSCSFPASPSASTPEVWAVPVVGGAPRRVGDLRAREAAWSPDGRNVVYTAGPIGNEVSVANSDGSGSRKIWTAPGEARWPAWSPDGRRLRLTVFAPSGPPSIWEIGADGQNAHSPLPAFESFSCCGRWTPDGKFFLFNVMGRHTFDLWVLREGTRWLSRTSALSPCGSHRVQSISITLFRAGTAGGSSRSA